ncbi:MAG: hypothetical protein RLY14_1885, partial [Planctomycetota bacterium]
KRGISSKITSRPIARSFRGELRDKYHKYKPLKATHKKQIAKIDSSQPPFNIPT